MNKDIKVTKTFLPPLEEYLEKLRGVWDRNWVSNHGPLSQEFEALLRKQLRNPYSRFVSNGTVALQIAIKALGWKGKVITTPFSYVATSSSLVWENCEPIFVDIDPRTLTIDPTAIASYLDSEVSGILATHVYGIPCDVEKIQSLAKFHGITVCYDGAHALGTLFKGKSLLTYGDISTLSFHATKIVHTIEGGAVISSNAELDKKVFQLFNFGHDGPENFASVGINGKNSEIHAAMGLCVLPRLEQFIAHRKKISDQYDRNLLTSTNLIRPEIPEDCQYNYSYYPVIFESESALLSAVNRLNEKSIYPRRYFYPSLNELPYVAYQSCPVSEDISRRVLCLPLSAELEIESVDLISDILVRGSRS